MRSAIALVILGWVSVGCLIAGDSEPSNDAANHVQGCDSVVAVEIFEGISAKQPWSLAKDAADQWDQSAFAWTALPKKYIRGGLIADRTNPFTLRATAKVEFSEGEYDFLLRAKNRARLLVDGKVILEQTRPIQKNKDSHEVTPELPSAVRPGHYPPPPIHHELTVRIPVAAGVHEVRAESLVGGPSLRTELGELCVAVAAADEDMFRVLSPDPASQFALTDESWHELVAVEQALLSTIDTKNRKSKAAEDDPFWQKRHEIARRHFDDEVIAAPAVKNSEYVANSVDRFIVAELDQRSIEPLALIDDMEFIRRVSLDTIGQTPTLDAIDRFVNDKRPDRRSHLIDRLLDDPGWADHWVPYWQDVLAENPNILKASLNNTGPFRWWIYESFLDNKPMDRFATDLILMKGSKYNGGPAGFQIATQNDVPEANKALILSEAFLATNMNCARCHDSPVNDVTQKQLFSIAAMLSGKALELPKTSTVIVAEGSRKPLIEISLKAGDLILPHWPLSDLSNETISREMLQDPSDSRAWLAAIVTSPRNKRFPQVIVNRLWHRYLGRGLVEPIDDWSDATSSHPELLDYLTRELVMHNYDLKHVARLILNSQTYQRQALSSSDTELQEKQIWFAAATRRRLTAEQVFDSLFAITGKPIHAETLTMDPEGRRPINTFLNLGTPIRAWQFSSLSNERDRPALSLPVAQSANDLLKSFGWREARQDAVTVRESTITPVQPLVLANGTMGGRLVGLSDDHAITELCLSDAPLSKIIDQLYLSFFTRYPKDDERQAITNLLADGFEDRAVLDVEPVRNAYKWQRHPVSWSNHLHSTSSEIMLRLEERARQGDPPTMRLSRDWRERMEDVLFALANNTEFMFSP